MAIFCVIGGTFFAPKSGLDKVLIHPSTLSYYSRVYEWGLSGQKLAHLHEKGTTDSWVCSIHVFDACGYHSLLSKRGSQLIAGTNLP